MASNPQVIGRDKVLEQVGKLHIQLAVAEEENQKLVQNNRSLAQQLQNTARIVSLFNELAPDEVKKAVDAKLAEKPDGAGNALFAAS